MPYISQAYPKVLPRNSLALPASPRQASLSTLPSSAPQPGTPGICSLYLARLRSSPYQDVGGTRRIILATHSLVLQFGHELAFQGVHLVGI
jgi:hypothetical protein